jgi:hypothetical protein
MKKIILLAMVFVALTSQAQIGGLLKKAKDKATNKDEPASTSTKPAETKSTTPTKPDEPKVSESKSSNEVKVQEKKTDGITSPSHQKYMNKIVFASEDASMAAAKEIESNFKTEFIVGQPIYFRAYFDNSLMNYINKFAENENIFDKYRNATFRINFYIDNKYIDSLSNANLPSEQFTDDQKNTRTSFRGSLKSVDNEMYIGYNAFNEIVTKHEDLLKLGKHQLKLEIVPIYKKWPSILKGDVIATGEITLNVKGNIVDTNDPLLCMPAADMKDPALEKQIKIDFLRQVKLTAGAVRILSSNWEIERNKYTSVVTKRSIVVSVGYTENKKCYKRSFIASQEYVGNKFLNEISFIYKSQSSANEINCKCIQEKK